MGLHEISLTLQLFHSQVGNIQEFDSQSSESSEAIPPPASCSSPLMHHPSPPPHLHTSTPTHPHRSLTIRDFANLTCPIVSEPTPEDLSITTPPSSPDLVSVKPLTNKAKVMKTSVWMKQIPLDPEGCLEETHMSLINNETAGLLQHRDSEKRGRGRGRKVVPGGLEEGLLHVIQRENSEITFWEHCSRKMESNNSSM